MDQLVLEIIKLLIMAAVGFGVYMFRRDLVPFIKSKMTADQFTAAKQYAEMFVYMAQQVFHDKTGAERKAIVTKALKEVLTATNISLTDQFIDDMIEAAVKGMKIAEAAGEIVVNTEITADAGKEG